MKTKNTILIYLSIVVGFISIITNSCKKEDNDDNSSRPITDKDGNVYTSVTIGTQTWMVENLKTTKYNDGTPIPNVTAASTWEALTTGSYSDYNNTTSNSTTYGRLYNWYAADNNAATKMASNGGKNVCPTGWHVPTDAEWTTLITFLGGENVAGGKLKETGTIHWTAPNTGGTNEAGFTALPGGYRYANGIFNSIGSFGYWLSSTEHSSTNIYNRYIFNGYGIVYKSSFDKRFGFSIRCLRD